MTISVITIVYNDKRGIRNTIENVIHQTRFNDIEYIIVNGASTDGTTSVIEEYMKYISKYICEPDTGIYNAMNKGLAIASGDYVIFINSGDMFSSENVVENIINSIGNDVPDVVYGSYRECQGSSVSKVIPCRNVDKIWYGPIASHQSTLYRLEHLQKYGLKYDESYRIAADYKLTAEAVKLASKCLKTNICISDFDLTGISSSNQNLGLKEANRVREDVFGWDKFKIRSLTAVLLCARYAKKYFGPIYKLIRY